MLTRRELTLLLFALTVYILFYNIDASVDLIRSSASNIPAARLADVVNSLRPDGRRLAKYVDALEREIIGVWESEVPQPYNLGPHGRTAREAKITWHGDAPLPVTKVFAHVPGYTVLENVYVANATIFLVTDDERSFPSRELVLSSAENYEAPPSDHDLQYITPAEAKARMGGWAARMNGVSWLSYGPSSVQDEFTFLALYRTHSAIFHGPAPDRTILIHTRATQWNQTGFDARLTRAIFPNMGVLFSEDWDDFHNTHAPFFCDRVVLADRGAALRGTPSFDFTSPSPYRHGPSDAAGLVTLSRTDTLLTFASAFALLGQKDWWAPARTRLLSYLSVAEEHKKKAITYVSTQNTRTGPRLGDTDHTALVAALQHLGTTQGWTVHIIELGGEDETPWNHQVLAAVRSSIMLGVTGDALANSIFMKPAEPSTPPPTVIEFFPDGAFWPAREFVSRTLGMDYIGCWSDQQFNRESLPPIFGGLSTEINVDVSAVIKTVRALMRRR